MSDLARRKEEARACFQALVEALKLRGASDLEPEAVRAATEFILTCNKRRGGAMGFTVDNVRHLDRLLSEHFYFSALTGEELYRMGCYLGELIRRNFGGSWTLHPVQGKVAVKVGPVYAFPLDKVLRVLEDRAPEKLEAYVFILAKKRAAAAEPLPPGPRPTPHAEA
ncbi:MAG: hypothetical protein HY722_05770 [Planctomycetes bacterium]|nr:hypothetical protein [Planctomycetota bacterium]